MAPTRRSRSRSRSNGGASNGSSTTSKARKRARSKTQNKKNKEVRKEAKKTDGSDAWSWNFRKDLVAEDGTVNYLAFGSNMSKDKMKSRHVEWTSVRRASVPGWRLAFNQVGFPPIEPCFASTEPIGASDESEGAAAQHPILHGLIYKMTPAMFHQLILQEGANGWYENLKVEARVCELERGEVVLCSVLFWLA